MLHMSQLHSCRAMCKIHGDHSNKILIRAECTYIHWIWITMEELFVKWVPGNGLSLHIAYVT